MKIIFLVNLFYIFSIKTPFTEAEGSQVGVSLYNAGLVTQAMKRPQHWFVNVMSQKDNEKYFSDAEYNGLRYQTEELQDRLQEDYQTYVNNYYDEKLRNEVKKYKFLN
jgi:hypothetical protein